MTKRVFYLLAVLLLPCVVHGDQRYLLVFKPRTANDSPQVITDAEVAALGGRVLGRAPDRLLVTIPDAAVNGFAHHPRTKYLQPTVVGPQPVITPTSSTTGPRLMTSTASLPVAANNWGPPVTYQYDGVGNIISIGADTYNYDKLSRLQTSTTQGVPETYTYDAFGNLIQRQTNNGTPVLMPVTPANQLAPPTAYRYDTAGNYLGAAGSDTYDAFSMVRRKNVSSGDAYYVYTADDERIGVMPAGAHYWNWTFRDEGGQVLRQYQSFQDNGSKDWLWVEDYVYREGQLLGAERVTAEGGRRHFSLDHLGTPRLVTGESGLTVASHTYYPFGNEQTLLLQETARGFDREDPMKFTGQERDLNGSTITENTNYDDYMHARFYQPGWGRFLSVDPVIDEYVLRAPQGWNRYSYALNNPLRFTDPTGRDFSCHQQLNEDGDPETVCTDDVTTVATAPQPDRAAETASFWKDWFLERGPRVEKGVAQTAELAWKDFKNEFKDGGCVDVFVSASEEALNPFTPSLSTAAEPAAFSIAAFKYNAALRYAASRPNFLGGTGLVYPMKSSVVRSMVADANAAAASGALLTLDLAIVQGFADELQSIAAGTCQ